MERGHRWCQVCHFTPAPWKSKGHCLKADVWSQDQTMRPLCRVIPCGVCKWDTYGGLQGNEGSLLIRYHYGRNSVRPIVPNCGRSGTELKAPLHASTPCSPITSDDHQWPYHCCSSTCVLCWWFGTSGFWTKNVSFEPFWKQSGTTDVV